MTNPNPEGLPSVTPCKCGVMPQKEYVNGAGSYIYVCLNDSCTYEPLSLSPEQEWNLSQGDAPTDALGAALEDQKARAEAGVKVTRALGNADAEQCHQENVERIRAALEAWRKGR